MYIWGSQAVRGALLTVFISIYFLFLIFTRGESRPIFVVHLCLYSSCLCKLSALHRLACLPWIIRRM